MDEDTIIEMADMILAKVETYSEALRLLKAVEKEITYMAFEKPVK